MDNDKEIGQENKPNRLLKRDEDIVVDIVAKNPIPNEGNREIAQGNHNVGNYNPFPHWFFWRVFLGLKVWLLESPKQHYDQHVKMQHRLMLPRRQIQLLQ
uniref:Uncharacterized protein n=1 Tax=Opuntia streptacantha TaxID=393608 RepID=A0A7C8ZZI8_OPUST